MNHEEFLSNLCENLLSQKVDKLKLEFLLSEISSRKLKLLQVVESLQNILTHQNTSHRGRGIDLLSQILVCVPHDLFNSAEIAVITNYYCQCLKEHHSFLPATLRALLAIVKMKETLGEELQKILATLFQCVSCCTQTQKDRLHIYTILHVIVTNRISDIESMNLDFVLGFMSFIEGETDPECLLLIFKFLPAIIENFGLEHLAEEMFELLSCYFPVDFKTTGRDDTVITREDIAEALLLSMTVNESFCKQCLPIIMDKLCSSVKVAKLDSYKLLETCCQKISVNSFKSHSVEFWKSCQRDVLPGTDQEVCEAGLSALSKVVKLLTNDYETLCAFIDDILSSLKSLTSSVNEKMFQPAVKVLAAAASESKYATSKSLDFFKSFCRLFDVTAVTELKAILSSCLPFLEYCQHFKLTQSDDCKEVEVCNEFVTLYVTGAKNSDDEVRRISFLGCSSILSESDENLRKDMYDTLVENIKTKEDVKTSKEFRELLRKLAQFQAVELRKTLFEALDTSSSITDGVSSEERTNKFLLALSYLADLPDFIHFVVPVLLESIVKSVSSDPRKSLENLLNACKFSQKMTSPEFCNKIEKEHNVIERLLLWWKTMRNSDEKCLLVFSELLALITRHQPVDGQQKIVVVAEAVLGSVRPDVNIPNRSTIFNILTRIGLESETEVTRLSSCRLLASLLNKAPENVSAYLLSEILERIILELNSNSSLTHRTKFNCGYLFTWVMKGVIVRGGSQFENNVTKWFDFLGRDDVGNVVADHFLTVFKEDELFMNHESHCDIKVLYRQRLFEYFPTLLNMYHGSREPVKGNYLLALSLLLRGVPLHLVQTNVSAVVVVLLRCLNSENDVVLLTALEVLVRLLEAREKVLGDHIGNFVPKFLGLAQNAVSASMKVRMNALKCLFFYGFFTTFTLLPYKNKVTHGLEPCLDDKKRLVRKEAVRARCRWFLVGAPGEDVLQSWELASSS